MSLVAELKRRNVFRVAGAYAVIAWLLAQIADVALDAFGAPDWVPKSVLFLLILGFPVAVFFAWAFEMTPEGVKREKDVDREQSITQETGRKLNRLTIGVLLAAVAFLLVDKFVLQHEAAPPTVAATPAVETEKSVAVLPFVAMSSGPDDEYFADGLTEEILNSLAQLPDLLVTARTSAFAFKGQDIPIPEIAAKLGVANVVEGSVRRAGERLRVTAQLIRAADGFHLWSETYERSAEDSFRVQDEIAEKVASVLNVVLDDAQRERMRGSGLRNPEAFIAFQKGVEYFDAAHETDFTRQPILLAQANELFDVALALEPDNSSAHFRHADYFIHVIVADREDGEIPADEFADALANAKSDLQNAVRTALTEADRLNAMLEYVVISEEWGRTAELVASATEATGCISPSWWSVIINNQKQLDDARKIWKQAIACDPMHFYNWANFATALVADGDPEQALEVAEAGMRTIPHQQIAGAIVDAYLALGQYDEASAAVQRLFDDAETRMSSSLSIAAARGDVREVDALRARVIEEFGVGTVTIGHWAVMGERERANEIAAQLDASPLGYLRLLEAAESCKCGAPFDIEMTPVLARVIEQTELVWPPRSPIDWPLKNW